MNLLSGITRMVRTFGCFRANLPTAAPLPKRDRTIFSNAVLVSCLLVGTVAAEPLTTSGRAKPAPEVSLQRSFADWKAACDRLPPNRTMRGRLPAPSLLPLPKFAEFQAVVTAFLEQSKGGFLSQATNWVGEQPNAPFFNTETTYFLKSKGPNAPTFQPFAQKVEVPERSEVFFHADFHGDVRSLLTDLNWLNEHQYLRGFEIARTNFYMIFLGDYTDRGSYGIETLYTLFRLKLANPDRVFLARGNHEEVSLQSRYGFLEEGRGKYATEFNPLKLLRAYDFLPVVIYLGANGNYIQCNHGGVEPGYDPSEILGADGAIRLQFLGALNEKQFLLKHPEWLAKADAASRELAPRALVDFQPEDPLSPSILGFMWNDFSVLSSDPQFAVDPGRAFVYGEKATAFLLQSVSGPGHTLQAIFRGHQQSPVLNPMMRRIVASRGVFRHWQTEDSTGLLDAPVTELARKLEHGSERSIPAGSVWTFNVSPDSIYGEGCSYTYDTFGILKTSSAFTDWRLQVVNVPVP